MHAHAHVPITNQDDDITLEFSTYDILAGFNTLGLEIQLNYNILTCQ